MPNEDLPANQEKKVITAHDIDYNEEDKLSWEYNIPQSIGIEVIYEPNCRICKEEKISKWIGKYLLARIPMDRLKALIEYKFGKVYSDEEIIGHKKHIKSYYSIDEEIRSNGKEQMKIIESDLKAKVDVKQIISSRIRALQSRILVMEKQEEFGREYIELNRTLSRLLEMEHKKESNSESSSGIFPVSPTQLFPVGGNVKLEEEKYDTSDGKRGTIHRIDISDSKRKRTDD